MQLLDSDWPANILAASHFRAQETRALSPDGVCALARARLGTRLPPPVQCQSGDFPYSYTLYVVIAAIIHISCVTTFIPGTLLHVVSFLL